MPLPSVDVSVVDEALHRPMAGSPSLRETILRLALHRPCTDAVILDVCAALERQLNTRVRCDFRREAGHVIHGIGRSPAGYTSGWDSGIDVTIGLATDDQLREINEALLEIVPVGVVIRVQGEDGRSWAQEYARRAYGIERREPAPRSYELGDGLRVNFGEGTQQWMTREEILRQRLRSEVDGRVFTIAGLERATLIMRTVLGVDVEWDYSTGEGLDGTPDLRVHVRRGTQEDVDIITRVLREIAPIGLRLRVQGEGRIEKIEATVSIKPEVGTCPVRDRFQRILADDEAA